MQKRAMTSWATALVLLASGWLGTSVAHADPIDTTSKTEVAEAYNAQLVPALKVKPKWTGSVAKCKNGKPTTQPRAAAGNESSASTKATFTAVNFYRRLAGLEPVKENTKLSAKAQQTALIMRANETLSHYPASSWKCYSKHGGATAARSNIAISWGSSAGAGAHSISLYMDDYGDHNKEVGHRRWILNPEASRFGTGSTSRTNALYVYSDAKSDNANPRPKGGTAWPSKGYFPWETVPTSKRWSYSLPLVFDEDTWNYNYDQFDKAKVTMAKNGKNLKTKVIARGWGAGDPSLVWETPKLTQPKSGKTDSYKVTITGIKGAKKVSYTVKVFTATYKSLTRTPTPTVSGTAKVGATLTAKPGTWQPSGVKLTYQWYRGSSKITGAKAKTYTVTKADKGAQIKVRVKGSKSGYATVYKHSAHTKKVA